MLSTRRRVIADQNGKANATWYDKPMTHQTKQSVRNARAGGMQHHKLEADLTRLVDCFLAHNLHLVAAESCTGGWIGKLCSDLAGSSRWFEASIVTYSNQAKCALLGVDAATLSDCGPVSKEVVGEMARGALEQVPSANISVAVSGVAGPGGGTERILPGTVWIAWCRRESEPVSRCFHFQGNRNAVRFDAARAALAGLSDLLIPDEA